MLAACFLDSVCVVHVCKYVQVCVCMCDPGPSSCQAGPHHCMPQAVCFLLLNDVISIKITASSQKNKTECLQSYCESQLSNRQIINYAITPRSPQKYLEDRCLSETQVERGRNMRRVLEAYSLHSCGQHSRQSLALALRSLWRVCNA